VAAARAPRADAVIQAGPFDLAVVGAGPAGAAAALAAARRGLAVVVFDPVSRADKPCGEGILPAGVAALRALGLESVLREAADLPRLRYVLASGRTLEIPFPTPGRALERPALQAALDAALAREAGITRLALRVSTEREDTGFLLRSERSPGESWRARTLIAADGLGGEAGAWLRGPRGPARRYGLRARAQTHEPLRHVEVHLGHGAEVYLTPLPEGRVNVAVLRDALPEGRRGAQALLEDALRAHPRAAERLGAWVTAPEARALYRRHPRAVARAGCFLTGDAAGGVDPVLGCGVALALTTGMAAGVAAAGRVHGTEPAPERAYARLVRRESGLRRTLARSLAWMAHHPRLQDGVAALLSTWPRAGALLAARVGGT